MDSLGQWFGIATGVVVVLGAFVAVARWLWPRVSGFFSAISGGLETLNGRPAVVDKAGREVEPAVPSLSVQIGDLARLVADQSEQNHRLDRIEKRLDRLEDGAQTERIAARADSYQAFRAIEAVANGDHEEDK